MEGLCPGASREGCHEEGSIRQGEAEKEIVSYIVNMKNLARCEQVCCSALFIIDTDVSLISTPPSVFLFIFLCFDLSIEGGGIGLLLSGIFITMAPLHRSWIEEYIHINIPTLPTPHETHSIRATMLLLLSPI